MAIYISDSRWIIFSSESHCVLGVGNMSKNARYCVTCGKKFYPKSYYAYPSDEYHFDYENRETTRYEVLPMHKHFHSQSCMKEWLARYSQEFSNLVDNISHNMIQDNSNQEKG